MSNTVILKDINNEYSILAELDSPVNTQVMNTIIKWGNRLFKVHAITARIDDRPPILTVRELVHAAIANRLTDNMFKEMRAELIETIQDQQRKPTTITSPWCTDMASVLSCAGNHLKLLIENEFSFHVEPREKNGETLYQLTTKIYPIKAIGLESR